MTKRIKTTLRIKGQVRHMGSLPANDVIQHEARKMVDSMFEMFGTRTRAGVCISYEKKPGMYQFAEDFMIGIEKKLRKPAKASA